MPQPLAGNLRKDAVGKQMGCVSVAQVVEPEMRKPCGEQFGDAVLSMSAIIWARRSFSQYRLAADRPRKKPVGPRRGAVRESDLRSPTPAKSSSRLVRP